VVDDIGMLPRRAGSSRGVLPHRRRRLRTPLGRDHQQHPPQRHGHDHAENPCHRNS
jgi:hypothetical protein